MGKVRDLSGIGFCFGLLLGVCVGLVGCDGEGAEGVVKTDAVFSAASMYLSRLDEVSLKKLRAMETMLKNAGGEPVLRMNWNTYADLVLANPAPYHLFVLYGTDKVRMCRKCGLVYASFREAARSFQVMNRLGLRRLEEYQWSFGDFANLDDRGEELDEYVVTRGPDGKLSLVRAAPRQNSVDDSKAVRTSAGYTVTSSMHDNALPVYFVYVDVFENEKIPEVHQFRGMPLLYSSAGGIVKGKKDNAYAPLIRKNSFVPLSIHEHAKNMRFLANIFVDWMNTYIVETSDQVQPVELAAKQGEGFRGTVKLFSTIVLIFLSIISFLFLFYKIVVRAMINYPITMPIAAWAAFIATTCGLFHAFKMQSDFLGTDGGKLVVFFKHGRTQTYAEGIVVGLLNAVIAPLIILIFKLKLIKQLREHNPKISQVIYIVLNFLLFVCFYGLYACYLFKSGWYHPTFFPPEDYIRGPISMDRKSILQ